MPEVSQYSGVPQSQFSPEDLRMLGDNVLIRMEEPEKLTASKILWIPDTAKRLESELYQGTVLAVGPGAMRKCDGARNAAEVKVGDRCFYYWGFGEMNVTAIRDGEGRECRIIPESAIQGVIEA